LKNHQIGKENFKIIKQRFLAKKNIIENSPSFLLTSTNISTILKCTNTSKNIFLNTTEACGVFWIVEISSELYAPKRVFIM